jgi:hypothetical protein
MVSVLDAAAEELLDFVREGVVLAARVSVMDLDLQTHGIADRGREGALHHGVRAAIVERLALFVGEATKLERRDATQIADKVALTEEQIRQLRVLALELAQEPYPAIRRAVGLDAWRRAAPAATLGRLPLWPRRLGLRLNLPLG